jgi:HK97 family phage major capsid protein
LRTKKLAAVTNSRALLDKADGEHRDLTAEELTQYNGYDTEITSLQGQIDREERTADFEADVRGSLSGADGNPALRGQPGAVPGAAPAVPVGDPRAAQTNTAEYRQGMLRYLIAGQRSAPVISDAAFSAEQRAILGVSLTGEEATGGVLAPATMERVLLDYIKQYNVMRRLASVRASNSNVEIPYTTGRATAYHMDEGAKFTKSTPSWDKKTMAAYKVGALSVVTHEAMQDMFIDLEAWIQDDFGLAFADLEENDFVNGNGTKQPRGFLLDATVGLTAASASAVTTDELIDIQYKLPRKHRDKAAWLMSESAIKLIRKLKDGNGQYIWQPGMKDDQPDRLLNKRVETCEKMADVGSASKSISFGDFSWYRILDRRGIYFQRLVELYAEDGQVGFLAYKRYDAKLLDATAIQVLQMKA